MSGFDTASLIALGVSFGLSSILVAVSFVAFLRAQAAFRAAHQDRLIADRERRETQASLEAANYARRLAEDERRQLQEERPLAKQAWLQAQDTQQVATLQAAQVEQEKQNIAQALAQIAE
jgi:hypothetical protein